MQDRTIAIVPQRTTGIARLMLHPAKPRRKHFLVDSGSEIEWRKWKWKWKSGSEDIINVWKAKGSVGRRKNPKLQYFSLPHIIQLDSTGLSLIQRAGLLFR